MLRPFDFVSRLSGPQYGVLRACLRPWTILLDACVTSSAEGALVAAAANDSHVIRFRLARG